MLGGFGGRDDLPIYKALYPRMVLRQGIECALAQQVGATVAHVSHSRLDPPDSDSDDGRGHAV